MDYSMAKEIWETKLQQVEDEILELAEHAVNYNDELEFYEEKSEIDLTELEWDSASDERAFGILQNRKWIYEAMIAAIDEAESAGNDKKKLHTQKKGIEMQISSIRKLKKESNEIIEREQQFICEADSAIDTLNEIRGKNA